MLSNHKRRPGRLVEHQDGRQGIAYNNDQLEDFINKDKVIVRFFIDNEINKGLADEKRSVSSDKLKQIGFVD